MGKSVGRALVDFDRRFRRQIKILHEQVSLRNGGPPVFLRRALPKRSNPKQKCVVKVTVRPLSPDTSKTFITSASILLANSQDGNKLAVLETTAAHQRNTLIFKRSHRFMRSRQVPSHMHFLLEISFSSRPGIRGSKVSKLTNTHFSLLCRGDEREWQRRQEQLPIHVHFVRFPLDSTQTTQALTLNDDWGDLFEVFVESEPRTIHARLDRRNHLVRATDDSQLGKILRHESLDLAAPEVEFRFPFGEGLVVRRVQRAKGRCIFCHAPFRLSSELCIHLAMEHWFESWSIDYHLEQGLVVATVTNTKIPPLAKPEGAAATFPKARRYVHSSTCEPLLPFEIDDDSEDEVDNRWLQDSRELLLDDIEDISGSERIIMKYWNRHVSFHSKGATSVSDLAMGALCSKFASENRAKLLPHRKEFLLHMINLWELGLVTYNEIVVAFSHLDQGQD